MPYQNKKITVVMPAYNAEKTLEACFAAIPKEFIDEVILVDDASRDNTFQLAQTLPIISHRHPQNRGYGGNQKTLYRLAQEREADVVIMVHPDHQYDPVFIPEFIRGIVDEGYHAVFGSRMMEKKKALEGGMPMWKFVPNIFLTQAGNLILGTNLTELHSGFRAYDTRIFRDIDVERNSDNFIFDTEIIIQLVSRGMRIKEIPITTRYFPEASQIRFGPSVKYGMGILKNLALYKTGLKKF